MESVEKESATHVAKDGDEISSTELDQESCLKKKKKPRRVSFAEITSVHVFDRDEDYETPPDNKPNTVEDRVRTLPGGSPRPSLKLLQDEDVDEHLQSTPTSGLQENESEQFVHEADTPGSMSDRGTPGEEGEFFGPVSLWHIAPGMSARSPVTDDITLDCTTFSLQFGKLMVPGKECVNAMEEVKTPAMEIEGRTPATEDFKTPVGGTRGPSQGNSMVLTKPKQPLSRQLVCDDDTLGNVEGMEDMRMTEEKQFKFDFANMHPDLDSLLAQKISELKPTIGTLPATNSEDAKLMPDKEVEQSSIEIASKNGKNAIGIFSAKTDEDTKLGPVKRATTEMSSTQNNKDTKLIPCGEMNLPTSEIASETDKNTGGTLLVNNNEDIKLTPDEVKHQQRELGLISPAQKIKLKSCDDEVHGPITEINTTRHYNDTKATLHMEFRQSSIESATAKQSNDTKVMSVNDSSFIQFEGEQKQKQKEMFWDAEKCIEPKDPVYVELRVSTFEIMSGNNQNKGSSKVDLELMAKHSYGLIESSLEHDAYSSHANSINQGNSKGQNQKGSFLIQRVNNEGIGLEGTGKNLLSNKYEDSAVKQSGSVELQEICACYTPLKAIHSATKQPGSANLQEMHAHFTPAKAERSIVKQNLFSNKYEISAVKQSGSAELQEIRACHNPLKAVHSASKQSGSVKLKDIHAHFTPTKAEGSVVKQSSSVELQEVPAFYTPLKADHFVAKQSGSGKLREICAHFTPTKAEGSVVKQSGSVKPYAHSDTRAMTEEAPVKFSQEGEDLCPPLITKPSTLQECLRFLFLQRPQLCLLQDTLKQLQEDMGMIKNASNPQFQALEGKKHLELENKLILPNHQRIGYVKWLQKVLAYERSKLLLLQTKKDELMNKFQELHAGCEEVDRLKCIYLQKQFAFNTSGRTVMKARSGAEAEAYIQFLKAEIGKQVEKFSNKKLHTESRLKGIERENQMAQERVIKMEQELRILGNKIQHIREFYCGLLKVESKTRKQDIAELLRNHVKERSQATVILEEMQLWKLKEMKSKLEENFIELSYSNIISQRFVLERDGRDANILACLSLNHEYIEKVFPFMNASAVFGLVLGSKQSCKIAGVGNICQVIQETSFLHGTLIDVLEEVQSCRSRLLNLSFTHFDCINGCGLQLQLKFINDRTGLEASLVLDMSNLLRGVYPSDALPLEVKILQDTRQPKSILVVEEVDKEIRVLQTGYPRIKNLCDRVSRLIEKNR